ncbi:glycosyltransferase family 4 protein [Orrella sp. JC864]|uniref:glycosyltransferase family 4 protein n=1 Tax=Orrella sp. JC864 TaxID=3120298 RepID=UPI00300AC4EE
MSADPIAAAAQGLPQRILILIHSLHGGGAERVAADLSAQWARAGAEVTLVTLAGADKDVYALHPDVRRVALGMAGDSGGGMRGLLANLRRVRALRLRIVASRAQVVLGMMTTASVLAVLAARGLPVRVIATEHTHPPSQSLSRLWRQLRRYAYPRAHRVVALTRDTARWIETHVPGSRLAVIPNPVHWPLQHEPPVVAPPPAGPRILLAVGRLHRDKGFDMLLQAYARIAARFPDWHLVILGEGAERAALAAQIARLGLDGRVSLPGRVGNMDQWYARADLYVLSSRVEGLSNTLLEAMASGLAAVAFDCETGPREIVRDGVDGVLVRPAADEQALAQALAGVMGDEGRRAALAAQAVQVRERFSVERVLGLWRQVLAGGPATARVPAGGGASPSDS